MGVHAHWRHLANTAEPMCVAAVSASACHHGGGAAFCTNNVGNLVIDTH